MIDSHKWTATPFQYLDNILRHLSRFQREEEIRYQRMSSIESLVSLILLKSLVVNIGTARAGCTQGPPCLQGAVCDLTEDKCRCPPNFIGDICQFEVTNLSGNQLAVCLAASSSLSPGQGCEKAIDDLYDNNDPLEEWVTDADGVGAFIVIDLSPQTTKVLGVKVLQRCDAQVQSKSIAVSVNGGSVFLADLECDQSNACDDGHYWQDIQFAATEPDTSIIKVTVTDVCGTNSAANVGFREIVVYGPIDECAFDPCQHSADCVESDYGYSCSCLPGYTGINCETDIDDCAGVACANGMVCVDGVDSYTCQCPLGFTGVNCDSNIDDCAGVACPNGMVCVDGVDSYTCQCPRGFTGVDCDSNIDDCAGVVCPNPLVCVDSVDAYTCECPRGFAGVNCECDIECTYVDVSERVNCGQPGGTRAECEAAGCCFDKSIRKTFWCFQKTGQPCNAAVCQHGGTCVNDADGLGHTCLCADQWEGDSCQIGIGIATTCKVQKGARTVCGFWGITRHQCEALGCCFDRTPRVIQCYFNEVA